MMHISRKLEFSRRLRISDVSSQLLRMPVVSSVKQIKTVQNVLPSAWKKFFCFVDYTRVKLNHQFGFGTLLTASYVNCVPNPGESQPEELSFLNLEEQLKNSSLDSIAVVSSLALDVIQATINAASEYMKSLNDYIFVVDRLRLLNENSPSREEFEDAVISARIDVNDKKKKFLDLMSMSKSVGKITSALFELVIFIDPESNSKAISVVQRLISLHEKIVQGLEDIIKKYENERLLVEKRSIEDSKH